MELKTKNGKRITWKEAVTYMRTKDVVADDEEITVEGEYAYLVRFADGDGLVVQSRYDTGYSEWTPGDGIQLPATYYFEKLPKDKKWNKL